MTIHYSSPKGWFHVAAEPRIWSQLYTFTIFFKNIIEFDFYSEDCASSYIRLFYITKRERTQSRRLKSTASQRPAYVRQFPDSNINYPHFNLNVAMLAGHSWHAFSRNSVAHIPKHLIKNNIRSDRAIRKFRNWIISSALALIRIEANPMNNDYCNRNAMKNPYQAHNTHYEWALYAWLTSFQSHSACMNARFRNVCDGKRKAQEVGKLRPLQDLQHISTLLMCTFSSSFIFGYLQKWAHKFRRNMAVWLDVVANSIRKRLFFDINSIFN